MTKPTRRVAGVTSETPEISKRKTKYNPVAGFRIRPEIKGRIDALADDLKVSTSELAEVLFEFALEGYDKGILKLDRTPEKYSITRK